MADNADPVGIRAMAVDIWRAHAAQVLAGSDVHALVQWVCAGWLAGERVATYAALRTYDASFPIHPAACEPWLAAAERWAIIGWVWALRDEPGDRESVVDLVGAIRAGQVHEETAFLAQVDPAQRSRVALHLAAVYALAAAAEQLVVGNRDTAIRFLAVARDLADHASWMHGAITTRWLGVALTS